MNYFQERNSLLLGYISSTDYLKELQMKCLRWTAGAGGEHIYNFNWILIELEFLTRILNSWTDKVSFVI